MKHIAFIFVVALSLFTSSASADDLPWIRYFATDDQGVTTELLTGTQIKMGSYRLWAITSAGSLNCIFVDATGVRNEVTCWAPVPTFQMWPVLGDPAHLFLGTYRLEAILFSGPEFSGFMLLHPVRADFTVTKF
jgi:hypothetical protein